MQIRMMVVHLVQNRRDASFEPPFFDCIFLASGVAGKNVHLRQWRANIAVSGYRVHHVLHHGVTDAVPHEADREVAEQLADETGRPTFGEVGSAEVAAAEDQAVKRILPRSVLGQQTMQIDQPFPILLRHGQPGRAARLDAMRSLRNDHFE